MQNIEFIRLVIFVLNYLQFEKLIIENNLYKTNQKQLANSLIKQLKVTT